MCKHKMMKVSISVNRVRLVRKPQVQTLQQQLIPFIKYSKGHLADWGCYVTWNKKMKCISLAKYFCWKKTKNRNCGDKLSPNILISSDMELKRKKFRIFWVQLANALKFTRLIVWFVEISLCVVIFIVSCKLASHNTKPESNVRGSQLYTHVMV